MLRVIRPAFVVDLRHNESKADGQRVICYLLSVICYLLSVISTLDLIEERGAYESYEQGQECHTNQRKDNADY